MRFSSWLACCPLTKRVKETTEFLLIAYAFGLECLRLVAVLVVFVVSVLVLCCFLGFLGRVLFGRSSLTMAIATSMGMF